MCSEDKSLRSKVMDDVIAAAKIMIELEHKYIDKMFEMGDLENLKAEDLKNFIIKRTNEKLHELNYDYGFDYDAESAKQLDWFYHLTGGHTHTDFFAIRPTDYSKANEGEDFDDIW
jgi:ribonucleoside-diphosphate reductase beta chain